MHKKFDATAIEKKWQKEWKESGIYDAGDRDPKKEKEYVLVEWPYPSGNLHIGHWYAFAVPDIYVRYLRMNGKQVLFPMGFDAFGLPAENAAIKRKLDPKKWTNDNIAYMKNQLESMGNAFSWDKTTSSTDPEYYKWTQWMFTEFFKKGLAYRGKGIVNWCPGCNTVIANEQVLPNGACERSGDVIEKREMPQWLLKITDYADRLVDDLDKLDWPEHIKEAQRQWIGRSCGAKIRFQVKGERDKFIEVFTTRPDTLYGATYMVLAPEHPFVLEQIQNPKSEILNKSEVEKYINETKQKSEQDRLDATKEKTGVKLEGITAINPGSGEEIPVFIADYVLAGYGTGAIMAVPAHDERDGEFARKFGLPVRQVVAPVFNEKKDTKQTRQGVYAVIKNDKNEYLIQYYKTPNYFWLPGGGFKSEESEIECLKREIVEETGYTDFEIKEKVGELFYDYGEQDNHIGRNRGHVYVVELKSDAQQAVKLEDDEIYDGLEERWIPANEIEKVLSAGTSSRTHFVLQALGLAGGSKYVGPGELINSGEFDGMDSEVAKEAITKKVGGEMTNTYRLRDWSIGRQRYWGVPIPIVYDPEGNAHPVPEEHLPWLLPEDVDPTPTGDAPLAKSEELKKRTEEIFGKGWTPEVETMDTFVDSSWYFLRYLDNKNNKSLSSLEEQKNWMPIDIYFGGAEHTTMHLLYSRFWQKALFDIGLATADEPYKRRINRGLILGPDGNKMSKSKGNVIDPDEQVRLVGADSVKMYLAFMGPYEGSNYPWDMGGIAGVRRFLERVYGLKEHVVDKEKKEVTKLLHKTIAKVRKDVELFKFNTAISAMMIFVNSAEKNGLGEESYKKFLKVLAPFAPHLTEELWHESGSKNSIHQETFPVADEQLAKEDTVVIGVQVNGKLRGQIDVATDADEEVAISLAKANKNIIKYLSGKEPKKVIYVPGRILNLIT